ncbi:exoribonuclease [Aaosphaeria arxii CBS 175.79]|uniref:Exosome complex component RRP45 n=1 Tax=Aaosphaeria arxii CBS 175.79 TaxID=1450172 RepID=A0A6A5XS22_9PLEO|nr:exoribonuclease [Aaosphaeria arxii CBS 175.79]KAF2015500.1 exoribonuclease [Aaosphaeria arxii CBS 175.79]
MPREAEISVNERAFILQALQEDIRLDGRAFDAFRPLELSFGDEYGVADVQFGKTRVIARISVDVTAPLPERKFDGIFQIVTEFSPMASPAFEVGRPTDAEVILARILEKTIRRSNALDTESLCIIAGLKCFALRADVHIIDHDGGLIDASCVAVMAALQHFRRPDVIVEGEKATILSIREREPIPLSILHQPLCVTFSYFEEGEIFLVDANLAEEQVRQGEVIISMNKHGEICQVAKYGGATIDALALLNCTNVALQKVKEFSKTIQKRLEEDAKKRDAGGLMAELSAENAR